MDVPILITSLRPIQLFNSSSFRFIWGTRAVEAQFQIEAPDPYPLLKQRTDLSKPVVLSTSSSVTYIIMWPVCLQLPVPKPTIQINLRITLTPWKERIVKLEVENLTYQITWQVQFLFFWGGEHLMCFQETHLQSPHQWLGTAGLPRFLVTVSKMKTFILTPVWIEMK